MTMGPCGFDSQIPWELENQGKCLQEQGKGSSMISGIMISTYLNDPQPPGDVRSPTDSFFSYLSEPQPSGGVGNPAETSVKDA